MVNIILNGKPLQVERGRTILDVARENGVNIPTLCYLEGINEIGACRMCVVEIEGMDRLQASCNTECQEGMNITTNNIRIRIARRRNLELLLSQHDISCPTCNRNNNCQLQELCATYAVSVAPVDRFKKQLSNRRWINDAPIVKNEDKCVKCYRCVAVCEKVQTVNIWDMEGSGGKTRVGVSERRMIGDSNCTYCGQCITHCPTDALYSRDDTKQIFGVMGEIERKEKTVIVQVAPAVRAAWGEEFNLLPEQATEKRLAAALRRVGFNYVFDTNYSADLTIMEEGTEFLERLPIIKATKKPMFTSCCPGWVRFIKGNYPDMVDQLSSAKSPQQMFGAVTKTYFANKIGKAPEDIICVSIMPCTSKKGELNIPNINDAKEGVKDVDFALTTRELCRMLKIQDIDVASLPEEDFDSPLGTGSGAAVIFGSTGGVMEAALRTCYKVATGKNPNPDTFKDVRAYGSEKPWIEAEYDVAGTKVRTAVVNGLGNVRKLIRELRKGRVEYDFVEVMACPGGCAGGGGQPIHFNEEWAAKRAEVLYKYDSHNTIRFSHENPDVQTLYNDFLDKPCSHKAHELLHTDHNGWEMPLSPELDSDVVIKHR